MASNQENTGYFRSFVARQRRAGALILQPRMGFADVERMRGGLLAVRRCPGPCIGTITVDSFTRVNDLSGAKRALASGVSLNGFPIASYSAETNRTLLSGILSPEFPVQVRHGSALPNHIIHALLAAGLDATEGGPISYCLPYSRVSLERSVAAWAEACRTLAQATNATGTICHLESFGGCMLGQLCPPSLLLAISVLEGIFSARHGVGSLSLSFAQGTNREQDVSALFALRRLAEHFLSDVDWHVVFYTFMGKFPHSRRGAASLIADSVRIARSGACERMICKTLVEASRIPSVRDNVEGMEWARSVADLDEPTIVPNEQEALLYDQARFLVELVLDLKRDIGAALVAAFEHGYLDIPYCLHPDNRNLIRPSLDSVGNIEFSRLGNVPLSSQVAVAQNRPESSSELLHMLSYNQRKYDEGSMHEEGA